jgi:hypothetical protein
MEKSLDILKITFNAALIVVAILFIRTFQRLLGINCNSEYTVEMPLCHQMTNLCTFCFVTILFLIAGWGFLNVLKPHFGEKISQTATHLRFVIIIIIICLVIGLAITGNYFIHRIDRWF